MPVSNRGQFFLLAIIGMYLVSLAEPTMAQAKRPKAKYEPPEGKTLVAVGAALTANVEGYTKATGHTPHGAKIYCGLNGDGDVEHFKRNAQTVPEWGFLVVEFALDPAFPKESSKDTDKLSAFLRGEKDAGIETMGRAIKDRRVNNFPKS